MLLRLHRLDQECLQMDPHSLSWSSLGRRGCSRGACSTMLREQGGARKRQKISRRTVCKTADTEDGALQSTLSALDALLHPETKLQGADQDSDGAVPPDTSPTSSAAERSSAVASTSQAETSNVDWRSMDKKSLLQFGYNKGLSWIKDQVKPTKIIEEDDYLPRAKARFAYAILLANIVVYGVGLSRFFSEGPEGPTNYFLSLAEVNEAVERGEYFRIITASFLHDSFVHLGVSSYALLTIAPEAEAVLGSFAFLTTYLLGGAAGTALCFLLTDTITVGASSGIFGLIGAMGAFLYKNHKAPKSSDGLLAAVGLLAFNFFLGNDHTTTVDNVGHFGGLVCGIYLGVLLSPAVLEVPNPNDGPPNPADPMAKGVTGALYTAAEATTPANAVPAKEAATSSSAQGNSGDQLEPRNVKVVQPNRLQSIIVLSCVIITLASSVAATVIHRTGELPLPKWL